MSMNMISQCARLEYRIGEKIFYLYTDLDATTWMIKGVASQIIEHMCEIERKAAEAAPRAEDAEAEEKEGS